jgi:hypothetical protein
MKELSKLLAICAIVLASLFIVTPDATAQAPFCQFCNGGSQCGQPCINGNTGQMTTCGGMEQCDFNSCGSYTDLTFDRARRDTGYTDGDRCLYDHLVLAVEKSSCTGENLGCSYYWSSEYKDCGLGYEDANQSTYDTYCN